MGAFTGFKIIFVFMVWKLFELVSRVIFLEEIGQKIRLDNTKQLMYVLIQIIVLLYTPNCI